MIVVIALGVSVAVMTVGVNLKREGAILGLGYYLVSVFMAPVFFVANWLRGSEHVPTDTLLISLAGLVPLPAHPIFRRRWAAAVTVAGLGFWLFAALIVAGAPI